VARILLTVPPLTGHINPALSVAAELERRGHEVRWAAHTVATGDLIPAAAKVMALPLDEEFMAGLQEKSQKVRGLASVQFLYEDFCLPLARCSLAPLERIVREFQPDIILCDHQMLAGALVARRLGVPWLSLVTTTASILKMSHVDVVENWVVAQLRALQADYGMDKIIDRPDFSPYGVIVFSSPELMGDQHERYPATYHFVGPAFTHRPQAIEFPWSRLEPGMDKVLVSLGTVSRDRGLRFYEVLIEALADLPLQVIMVGPEVLRAKAPENFIIQPRVPQVALLPQMKAVVCHAGHNTVCESLSYGLPLIVAPIRDDQPVIAQQVVDAGAGLYMRYGKVSVNVARETMQRLLHEPQFRLHAQQLAESFKRLGGATQAADVVAEYLAAPQALH
jgi:MGT family glycosyltransferase